MFNAVFIYQDPARDTSAYSVARFSVLLIMHSNFERGHTMFEYSAGGLTLVFLQKFHHVSIMQCSRRIRVSLAVAYTLAQVNAAL